MRQTTPAEERSFGTEHGATQLCPPGDGDGVWGRREPGTGRWGQREP